MLHQNNNNTADFHAKNELGQGLVLQAVANGNLEELHTLLAPIEAGGQGLSLDVTDMDNNGPVMTAIKYNQIQMLRKLVTKPKKGGYGCSINVIDRNYNDAVLIAASKGYIELLRELIKSKKKGGFGLSLDSTNNNGNNALLLAIRNNQIQMVKALLSKKKNHGFGLPYKALKITNDYGIDSILIAVIYATSDMLYLLTDALEQGGFGLTMESKNYDGNGAIELAVINDRIDMLEILTSKHDLNDYYVLYENDIHILLNLAKQYSKKQSFSWLVKHNFDNHLKSKGCISAINWINTNIEEFSIYIDKLDAMLYELYHNIIKSIFKKMKISSQESDELKLLITSIMGLSVFNSERLKKLFMSEFNRKLHDYHFEVAINWATSIKDHNLTLKFFYAGLCLNYRDYQNAYDNYLSVYNNPLTTEPMKQSSGFELANLLFDNKVNTNEPRLKMASQFLEGNTSQEAVILKTYCDKIYILGDYSLVTYPKNTVSSLSMFRKGYQEGFKGNVSPNCEMNLSAC